MPELENKKPNPLQLRAELERMVVGDLLGPAGGPDEELDERTVRDRYLVGVLAPRRQVIAASTATARPAEAEDDDEDTPLIPDELSEGGTDTADDGKTDQDVAVTQAHLPSSFGITFCVSGGAKTLHVEASWGQYLREVKENQTNKKTGKPIRVWKRNPRGGTVEVPLKDGTVKRASFDARSPGVFLQGLMRHRNTHWIVTLFLVNGQEEARPKDEFHVFQPELVVRATDGSAVFEKRMERTGGSKLDPKEKLEHETMEMLYPRQVEFAVGHGVSVHAEVSPTNRDRAVLVRSQIIPRYEVPQTTPPTADDFDENPAFGKLKGLVLDMRELGETPSAGIRKKLEPLVTAYREWIAGQTAKLGDPQEGLGHFKDAADTAIENCRATLQRLEAGLKLVEENGQASEAFRFMNRAMWLQRTHSIYSEQVRRQSQPDFDKEIDVPANRTWRPFQLAFILLNLPALRSSTIPPAAKVRKLWPICCFSRPAAARQKPPPGLSAYTMGIRRLQGIVAGRSGENGVTVLMRYTLRLLTIQQFQRATALICACESIRRKALEQGDQRWGLTPFRIGLWVGRRTTPNRTDDAAEAIKQYRGGQYGGGGGIGTPYQLTTCPWCGSTIEPGKHLEGKAVFARIQPAR